MPPKRSVAPATEPTAIQTPTSKAARARAGSAPSADATEPTPSPGATYTITQLAAEFDITPRAIRFYEDMGLLQPTRKGRNRVYSLRDRTRLKLTLRGKRLGLALQDIKQLIDMYDAEVGAAPQLRAFLALLRQHREQLEQQRHDLEVTLAEIQQHERRCQALLEQRNSPKVVPARA